MDKYSTLQKTYELEKKWYLSHEEYLILKDDILIYKSKYNDITYFNFEKLCSLLNSGTLKRKEFNIEKSKIFFNHKLFSHDFNYDKNNLFWKALILPKYIKSDNIELIKKDISFFVRVNELVYYNINRTESELTDEEREELEEEQEWKYMKKEGVIEKEYKDDFYISASEKMYLDSLNYIDPQEEEESKIEEEKYFMKLCGCKNEEECNRINKIEYFRLWLDDSDILSDIYKNELYSYVDCIKNETELDEVIYLIELSLSKLGKSIN